MWSGGRPSFGPDKRVVALGISVPDNALDGSRFYSHFPLGSSDSGYLKLPWKVTVLIAVDSLTKMRMS
ncbi:hypothetical protein EMPS_07241 [Entomortierella parvispora]|uniref:Uncharacterized protein n=1 Tax=Entomortierella parvispora TaxID=205924 RepID=A0A9P3HEJ4_9FUNG|nr:hypothetical protein EMPS_07241 [Entomortierella parvispora]